MIGERLNAYEDEFLHQAERIAGRIASGFASRVKQRLALGAETYGNDNYLRIGLLKLLKELKYEGEDLGGYSALLSQGLMKEAHDGLDDDAVTKIQALAQQIAVYGALVDHVVDQIEETYKTAKGI